MKKFTFLLVTAALLCFVFVNVSYADCEQTGNTPGGGNIIDCPGPIQNTNLNTGSNPATTDFDDEVSVPAGGGLNVPGGRAINTADGNDMVITSGTVITEGNSDAIFTDIGDDTVIVNGGLIETPTQAISVGGGNNTVIVNGGILRTNIGNSGEIIDSGSGPDIITINSGIIGPPGGTDEIILSGGGPDIVTLNGGIYIKGDDEVIDLSGSNDTITFGGNIDLGGFVNCGSGVDTIIFAMEVPEELIPSVSSQIAAAGLPDGNVTINGILYEWVECEILLSELKPINETRPIPTLSQWGLIAMALVLGIAGVIYGRRRLATK